MIGSCDWYSPLFENGWFNWTVSPETVDDKEENVNVIMFRTDAMIAPSRTISSLSTPPMENPTSKLSSWFFESRSPPSQESERNEAEEEKKEDLLSFEYGEHKAEEPTNDNGYRVITAPDQFQEPPISFKYLFYSHANTAGDYSGPPEGTSKMIQIKPNRNLLDDIHASYSAVEDGTAFGPSEFAENTDHCHYAGETKVADSYDDGECKVDETDAEINPASDSDESFPRQRSEPTASSFNPSPTCATPTATSDSEELISKTQLKPRTKLQLYKFDDSLLRFSAREQRFGTSLIKKVRRNQRQGLTRPSQF